MKKYFLKKLLAVCTALSLLSSSAFAASFGDLQDAIDGNTGAGEFIGMHGDDHYGYGKNEDGSYGVESWTTTTENEDGTTTSSNNVQLNEDVQQEEGEAGIVIGDGQDVNLDLNGSDITGDGSSSIIEVDKGGSLTLDDTSDGEDVGEITGGHGKNEWNNPVTAGGVHVNGGDFTMEDGKITGNAGDTDKWNSNAAGGVTVSNGGEFTMNGGEISNNTTPSGSGGVFVTNGGSFTMNDGLISGNTGANGGGVSANGGEFTMTGGTITTNTANTEGGGVRVEGGVFNMTGGEITDNTSNYDGGGVRVKDKGTFNMGGGIISGNKLTNQFNTNGGAGVSVNGNGAVFNMTGGVISGHDVTEKEDGTYGKNGGGVYVGEGGTFNMSGSAEIKGNSAEYGGGVYVEEDGEFNMSGKAVIDGNTAKRGGGILSNGKFKMDGGTVSNNTATEYEGGGIVIYGGEGEISKGSIKGNKTETKSDLGGGGIYVNTGAKLTITNVVIRNNTAATMGGGLAACIRGETYVYATDGAAIFGNTAKGDLTHAVGNAFDDQFPADGGNIWRNWDETTRQLFLQAAQDIFTAGFKYSDTKGGTTVGNVMLGYNQQLGDATDLTPEQIAEMSKHLANWEGFRVLADDPDSLLSVGVGNNGTNFADRFLALTSNPTVWAQMMAIDAAMKNGVIIEDNESVYTHGGGIANNGVLIIGKQTDGISTAPDTELKKDFVDQDGNQLDLADNQFSFQLEGGLQVRDEATGEIRVENEKKVTASNDANGNAVFDFAPGTFTKPGTYVFYVTEEDTGAEGVTYDKTTYKITIVVGEEVVTGSIGNEQNSVKTLVIGDPLIEKVVFGENGETLERVDSIEFTNKYEAPEEPEEPEEPKEPEEPEEPESLFKIF